MKFGAIIREQRKKKGLTQAELAKKLDVSQPAIGKYEKDERTPSAEKLIQLSKILEYDFIEDVIKENEIHRQTFQMIEDGFDDPDLEMNTIFRLVAKELDLALYRDNDSYRIFNSNIRFNIDVEKVRGLYERFILHMALEFGALLESEGYRIYGNSGEEEKK